MRSKTPGHVADLLPAHASGTLGPEEEQRVRAHLGTCAACRASLASWEAVRGAVEEASEGLPAPPNAVMERAWDRIVEEAAPAGAWGVGSRLSLAWQLLAGQAPLVRKGIWAASAPTMALGCLVSLMVAVDTSAAGASFAVFAPIIAAVGVAFVYGPENDPSLEIALSTPTSPRLVLFARLTLVYAYDTALALAASAALYVIGGDVGLWPLVSLWFGPMLFLSALALLISLLFGANVATLAAVGLWGTRLVLEGGGRSGGISPGNASLQAFWRADAALLVLAVLLLAAAFIYAPRVGRLAREQEA